MAKPKSEKNLWEYALLAVSSFATLVQVLGLISQSQVLIAQPFVIVPFVVIVLIGTAIGCSFVLYRTKPGTFIAKVAYYTQRQRLIAGIMLATNLVVSALVIFSIFWRPCISSVEPFPTGKFGILVADFTEGLNRTPVLMGNELAKRTFNALNSRLTTSSIQENVDVKRICAIRNSEEALKAGRSANASLVLWGNAAEFTKDTFEPSFTFVNPLLWPSDIDPLLFEVELNRVDSADLPSKISARTTSMAAFVIGLIYLREAQTPQDYAPAVREFSFAIANTEPELTNVIAGSEQELALKRALAIFYVMRGRVYAAIGEGQQALGDYSEAEAKDPNYPSVYIAKGNYYYALRDFRQAETEYRKALSLRDLPTAYYGLGNVFFYTNRYQESINSYLKAISLIEAKGDDASGVRIILGVVYNLSGEAQLALEQLTKVLQSSQSTDSQKQQVQDIVTSIINSTPVLPTSPQRTSTPGGTTFPTKFPTLTAQASPSPTATPGLPPTLFPTPTITTIPGGS